MGRLCERPGCSETAALAYGMRPEDLVFWIDALRDGTPGNPGVLCQRHGDTMTVPRGWTLDDMRDPDLHLFRPPPRPDGPATRRNRMRRRPGSSDDTGQLALGGFLDDIDDIDDDPGHDTDGSADHDTAAETDSVAAPAAIDAPPSEPDEASRSGALDWKPAFDDADDLDGLLAARSPLLSRAFRGTRG